MAHILAAEAVPELLGANYGELVLGELVDIEEASRAERLTATISRAEHEINGLFCFVAGLEAFVAARKGRNTCFFSRVCFLHRLCAF